MFLFEWQCKSVDDRAKNLKELRYAIMSLGLVYELEEYVVYRPSDEGTQVEEFAVDTMQCGLQEIALSRIFGVE